MPLQLRAIRLSQGLSVPRLAELSGTSRRTIQEMEKRGEGTLASARKLADALGVTLDELYPSDQAGAE